MSTGQRAKDTAERPAQRQRGRRKARGSHAEASSDCAEARRACVTNAGAVEVTQKTREATQSLRGLTQRPGGLTLSLREALERVSWSNLSEYLLLKRGITAR